MALANQLPFAEILSVLLFNLTIANKIIAPDSKRTTVKLEASIALLPSANQHNTEFAAKATNANDVSNNVLTTPGLLGIVFKDRLSF